MSEDKFLDVHIHRSTGAIVTRLKPTLDEKQDVLLRENSWEHRLG